MTHKRRASRNFEESSPLIKEVNIYYFEIRPQLRSIKKVQREYRKHCFSNHLCRVPNILVFRRIVKRFEESGSVRPQVPKGLKGLSIEEV